MKHIEAELRRGPHPSSYSEEAMKALHKDTKDKSSKRNSKVIRYGEPNENLPEKLKYPQWP